MIEFQNVDKGFGAQKVLDNVSFRVNPGERIGIVGPNGAGKSTIFNLIVGEITPDKGRINIARSCSLGYLRQELREHELETSLIDYTSNAVGALMQLQEHIDALDEHLCEADGPISRAALRQLGEVQTRFEHMGGYDVRHRTEAALSGLGFSEESLSRPLRTFSGGWQIRAELARILVADPSVLLLDEPSNYLDIPAIEWLQRFLLKFKGTLVLISHDRFLLNSLTGITIEVANGLVERYAGNYEYYHEERQLRVAQRIAQRKNQDRKREQLERFIERFRAKNTLATQAQSRIKQLKRMDEEEVDIPKEIVSPGRIRLPDPPRSGQEVMRMEDAGLTYDGERWVLRRVNLHVERGQKFALVGLNGLGKTTLLRMMAGELPLSEGKRVVGHKVSIGYQSQSHTETLNPQHSVYEAIKSAAPSYADRMTRSLLGSFGFSGAAIEKKIQVLSGGEKIRVAFARLMTQPNNFLILDEPTTHLDIMARETLEEALKNYGGAICMVSHDIDFVRRVATDIIAMTPPGITRYWGGYDYYHEKLEQQRPAAEKAPVRQDKPRSVDRRAARQERARVLQEFAERARSWKSQFSHAEKQIARLEAEQAELVKPPADPNHKINYSAISRRLSAISDELAAATKSWEQAVEELDKLEKARQEAIASRGEKAQGAGLE